MTVPHGRSSPEGPVVVVGAGPAGLTAAYQLVKAGHRPLVVEADEVVGGLARTVVRDEWRFDVGGHRFFTKVGPVEALWHEILGDDDFPVRTRQSRILYDHRFFDYPLQAANALGGLGAIEAGRCILSYLWARAHPPADQSDYEGWLTARFGRRLYRTFFQTYTEKVWGVPAADLPADWAAQRVRSLDLGKALLHAVRPGRGGAGVTSLTEEFHYPRLGPGMLWERCAELVADGGGSLLLRTEVVGVHLEGGRATAVTLRHADGSSERVACGHVISSMPLPELVAALDPAAPPAVTAAAAGLHHRDFLTVALVVPEAAGFPDQWIYVHDPGVRVGRIQNFASWSPDMVRHGRTCLGLEYFVSAGDELWRASDEELVAQATDELEQLGLVDRRLVEAGYVVRVPKAYPFYDFAHRANVATVVAHLDAVAPNVHPVGRNGMHRYNNQDHSMLTAMLTVENILGANHDVWAADVELVRGAPVLPTPRSTRP